MRIINPALRSSSSGILLNFQKIPNKNSVVEPIFINVAACARTFFWEFFGVFKKPYQEATVTNKLFDIFS